MKYLRDNKRHLICVPYSIAGLHAMAHDLGIKRCWYHGGKHPHYDIPLNMAADIAARSELVSPKTIVCMIRWTQRDLFVRSA